MTKAEQERPPTGNKSINIRRRLLWQILISGEGFGYMAATPVWNFWPGYDIVVADNYYNSCPEALARVKKIAY